MPNLVEFDIIRRISTRRVGRYRSRQDPTFMSRVIALRRIGLAASWPAPPDRTQMGEGEDCAYAADPRVNANAAANAKMAFFIVRSPFPLRGGRCFLCRSTATSMAAFAERHCRERTLRTTRNRSSKSAISVREMFARATVLNLHFYRTCFKRRLTSAIAASTSSHALALGSAAPAANEQPPEL